MAKKTLLFFCTSCGNESYKWLGKCPACGEWNTFKEAPQSSLKSSSKNTSQNLSFFSEALAIKDIKVQKTLRYDTKMKELNRVLGGGVVPGSLVLIGGEPGIGKSTLMLQACENLSALGGVLYVSGEESPHQIKLRSKRLGVTGENILFLGETELEAIEETILAKSPDFLIIDSIQTCYISESDKIPGSVTQIREVASRLLQIAKNRNIATFIVGHVTKEGNIAGPKILEHIVDTVLYFESSTPHIILRAVKNRFGNTDEIGIFNMEEDGIKEVLNPHEIFMDDTEGEGIAVSCVSEGSRPLMLEVQALVSNSSFASPRRLSDGIEINKLNKILAVIEKQLRINLAAKDVYINLVGGIKVKEPAVDLALVAAILSSCYSKPLPKTSVFIGEVGLTGEIRPVSFLKERLSEVMRLTKGNIYLPASFKLQSESPNILQVKTLKELSKKLMFSK
jgi:DNA repair protein RadA/Sms